MAQSLSAETSYTEQLLHLFDLRERSASNPTSPTDADVALQPFVPDNAPFSMMTTQYLNLSPDMRLPGLISQPPAAMTPRREAIDAEVTAPTRPQGSMALDRTLRHAPVIADGWNAFVTAIQNQNSLPPDVKELVFCRVAALTGAWHQWEIHSPIAKLHGVDESVLAVIKTGAALSPYDPTSSLNDLQVAIVRYVDAMTLHAHVPQTVWHGVAAYFTEKQLVELTATVAGCNLVARFVVALNVGQMNDPRPG